MDKFDYPSLISICSVAVVAQWELVFWFSIVVFCTSQVLRNTLKIVRKIEETSPQMHMQYEMRALH